MQLIFIRLLHFIKGIHVVCNQYYSNRLFLSVLGYIESLVSVHTRVLYVGLRQKYITTVCVRVCVFVSV